MGAVRDGRAIVAFPICRPVLGSLICENERAA
jgi:hypothetical protein